MEVKNVLACLWFLTLAATEIKGQCSKPTLMEKAVINQFDNQIEVFNELSVVRLECIPGYEPPSTSPRTLTCVDGQWKPAPDRFICRKLAEQPEDGLNKMTIPTKTTWPTKFGQCIKPTLTSDAMIDERDIMINTFNDSATVRLGCIPGYEPTSTSPRTLTCKMGQWVPASGKFTCQKKSCGNPGDFANGHYEFPEGVEFGAKIKAVCKSGYYLIGQNTRICLADGEWDGREPVCEVVKCGPPPVIPNAQPPPENDYEYGQAIHYTCKDGYTLLGDNEPMDTVHCLESGTWSKAPRCVVVNCNTPHVPNARRVEGGSGPYDYRSTLRYECNKGYRMTSGTDRMVCLEHGWSSVPTCEVVRCGPPPVIPNGHPPPRHEYEYGQAIQYTCKDGYTLLGDTVHCLDSGTWSKEPQCVVVNCNTPHIPNARRAEGGYGPYYYRSTLRYECNEGYRMTSGTGRMVCLEHGWSSVPTCEDECRTPLGMESGGIPNRRVTASSVYGSLTDSWYPYYARLNNRGLINAWCPATNDQSQWLQVDLGRPRRVSGVITQGASSNFRQMYVKAFKVVYRDDGSWQTLRDPITGYDKIFKGNEDDDTAKKNMFNSPIRARYVQIYPLEWHKDIALRMELLGCRD